MVRRFALIVQGVAALIARRFLRDPRFGALVGPLWSWLNRRVQRFGRVRMVPVQRAAAVGAAAVGAAAVDAEAARVRPEAAARLRLPRGRGWLVRALGWEAAGYGSQLQALLAEPEIVALLAELPAVGRVLRPLGQMLGVTVGPEAVRPVTVRSVKARQASGRKPRAVKAVATEASRGWVLGWQGSPPKTRGSWWRG